MFFASLGLSGGADREFGWVLQNSYGGYADRVPDFIVVVKNGVIYTTETTIMEHGELLGSLDSQF
jgi:hypothetical protein